MRLACVEVDNLFGRFSYRIDMKLGDRLTILHGPNGCGKTTLLRLVGHALTGRFDAVAQTVFDRFTLTLDSGASVVFERQESDERARNERRPSAAPARLIARFDGQEGEVRLLTDETRESLGRYIDRFVSGYERVDVETWINTTTGARATIEDLFITHGDRLPAHIREQVAGREGKIAQKLRQFLSLLKVFVIDTQRLITARDGDVVLMEDTGRALIRHRREAPAQAPAVLSYARMLREEIRDHLQRYGIKASTLDRSLPARILAQGRAHGSSEDLRQRYEAVLDRRANLVRAGVLQEAQGFDVPFPDTSTLEPLAAHVLRMYLDDMEAKLSVFDGFVERVQLFISLINGLFKHKKILVGPREGFEFVTDEEQTLAPDRLSSGEQHQLVLLFDLLFRVSEHALILVDEPEISLHIEWQQQVLRNFQAISKLRDLDFLIATHSADIIYDRWDLATPLAQGVQDAQPC